MENENISLLYLNDFDIYVIDYAGTITMDKGLSNMGLIAKELRKLSLNKDCLKLIFDLSSTIWENRETHDELSKIARKIFNPNNFDFVLYTAILNNEIVGPTFENEHWFINKDDAINGWQKRNNIINISNQPAPFPFPISFLKILLVNIKYNFLIFAEINFY